MKQILTIILAIFLSNIVLAADVTGIVKNVTNCLTPNGEIELKFNGGTPPYTISWTGPNNYVSDKTYITNLVAGLYKVVIDDAYCGTVTLNFEVKDLVIDVKVTIDAHPCKGLKNGGFTIAATNPNQIYHFSSNSVPSFGPHGIPYDNGNAIDAWNLSAGTYTVTVADSYGSACNKVITVNLEEDNAELPTIIVEDVQEPCSGKNNGSITLQTAGDYYSTYTTFKWAAPIANYSYPYAPNLAPGTYSVTATRCSLKKELKIDLTGSQFKADLTQKDDCIGNGGLFSSITGKYNKPLKYLWSNGKTTPNLVSPAAGTYTVTITDNNGCSITASKVFSGTGYSIKLDNPCSGLNNGEIKITINNPKLEKVTVQQILPNGGILSLATSPLAVKMEIIIPNITPASPNKIKITIGNCSVIEELNILNDKPNDRVFSFGIIDQKNNTALCYYDLKCNDLPICTTFPKNVITPALICFSNSAILTPKAPGSWQGPFATCGFDATCKDFVNPKVTHTLPDHLKADRVTIKVGTYIALLLTLQANGIISPDFVDHALSVLPSKKVCATTKMCTATLEAGGTAGGYCPDGVVTAIGGGCFSQKCRVMPLCIPTVKTICLSNLFPDLKLDATVDCDVRQYTVGEIIAWETQIVQKYKSAYTNSTLAKFIQSVKSNPSKLEKSKCANVSFCLNAFLFIASNIENVEGCEFVGNLLPSGPGCGAPQPCDYICEGSDLVLCPNKLGHYDLKDSKKNFPINLFTNSNDNTNIVAVDNHDIGNEFLNFGTIKSDEEITPKGLFRAEKDNIFYDFWDGITNVKGTASPNVENFLDDYDKGEMIYTEKTSEEQTNFVYNHSNISFTNSFKSTQSVSIKTIVNKTDEILIGGLFTGDVYYKDDLLGVSDKQAAFITTIAKDGSLISTKIIKGNFINDDILFTSSDDDISISSISKDGKIFIDDKEESIDDETTSFTLSSNNNTIVGKLKIDDMELIKSANSKNGLFRTHAFYGKGVVSSNGNSLIKPNSEQFVIVSTDKNDKILWTKQFSFLEKNKKLFDFILDSNGFLTMGLTFDNAIEIDNTAFKSRGGSDIAIFKFDDKGELLSSKQYGSPDDENVKRIISNNFQTTYIGGELYGLSVKRQIGNNVYVKLEEGIKTAYIANISESDADAIGTKVANSSNIKTNILNTDIGFEAHPNPFEDKLQISISCKSNCEYTVLVYDILGNNVWSKSNLSGSNDFDIDISTKINSGIYLVHVKTSDGKLLTKRVTKL